MSAEPDDLSQKHLKLASNMRKLKARHDAALREIAFLRARLTETEPHAPLPPILTGFPTGYTVPRVPRSAVTYWKKAREKLLWSGLTAEQALHLEIGCLLRLAGTSAQGHFPSLLQVDLGKACFEVTDQGMTLKDRLARGQVMPVLNAEAQIAAIVGALDAARIVHLDMHPDGRNLALREDGHLSVIDFDIASLDGVAGSGEIALRLAQFQAEGGYEGFARKLHEIIARLT